jgi:SNF2 family DNA or RNA helicase
VEVPFFHGSLSLPARDAMVERFQQPEGGPPILVLSLRAGGVGLNLTRASHVMHFDRWWNPAIEDQATDRAYRIGQKQRVQVHHLITIGTLEERIDRMLEDKRGLADAVVAGGEAWITQLSTDEIRALVSLGSDAAVESIESWEKSA